MYKIVVTISSFLRANRAVCRKISIFGTRFIDFTDMNKKIVYPTQGVCSQAIAIELEDDVVKSVQFMGGCQGNTQGISMLVRGMKASEVIARLDGINCGGKGTSCPDQLARALRLMTK
jgi:uncharacterized protein (TIGR03905 family)